MIVNQLKMQNFRNYEAQIIEFSENRNIIHGDNAQGKTNILEAVYMFALGVSHRTYRDKEMIMFDRDSSKLELSYNSYGMNHTSEITLDKKQKKVIKLNSVPLQRSSEMVGQFSVVLFCPEHLGLIKDGPKERRRNLDIFISGLRPRYFSLLKQYKKLIINKNALLKKIRANPRHETTLDVWNEKLCTAGAEIIKYRQEYTKKLNETCYNIHNQITAGKEEILIKYAASTGEGTVEEIRAELAEKMRKYRAREMDYGESIIGPHRDDVEFYINEKEVRAYGSQGQQKTVVLTHKLAEVNLIKEEIGEYPVLLLDDILSELDPNRQDYIVSSIDDIQTIITDCRGGLWQPTKTTKMFHVKNGTVETTAT